MKRGLLVFLVVFLLLAACTATETPPVLTPTETMLPETATPSAVPTASPTSRPPVQLTICTTALPESLFPYAGPDPVVKQNVLAMIQDDALVFQEGESFSGILEKPPALQDGDMLLEPVVVQPGQTVVDARGELVVLKPGVNVRPAGCRGGDCVISWDGVSTLEMDRMVINFQIKPSVTWSDGTALTGQDSVFAYTLASAPQAPGLKWAESRTYSYVAPETHRVVWTGLPGFTTADLELFFWKPLPSFLFDAGTPWEQLIESDALVHAPLGYGPFFVRDWELDKLTLVLNPHYYRLSEGLPFFDEVILRTAPDAAAAWEMLQQGDCDLLDQSFGFENNPDLLSTIQSADGFDMLVQYGPVWEQLVLGIQPASYDEYYNPVYGDRPDIFGDLQVRQALAQCLDRAALVEAVFAGAGQVWQSFLSPEKTMLTDAQSLVYDPEQAAAILDLAGWKDHDLNPETPRQAWDVDNVPVGTLLTVDLYLRQTDFHAQMAEVIQKSLGQCGIGVNLVEMPAADLFAPGPDGPLFGRQFDLALLSWASLPGLDCGYYQSWQMPADGNNWIGTNLAGLQEPDYDQTCAEAGLALQDEAPGLIAAAEEAYLMNLPAIPLYGHADSVIFRKDKLCPMPAELTPEKFFKWIEIRSGEGNCP